MTRPVVWLTGMPRSGTNWVSQVLASSPALWMKSRPLFSYEFKNRCGQDSTAAEWRTLLAEVYETRSEYLDQDYLCRDGLLPTFADDSVNPAVLGIKSTRYHEFMPGLLDKVEEVKLVVLVCNPAAAVHSWISNGLEFPPDADPAAEWRTGARRKTAVGEYCGFDDWCSTTLAYLDLQQRLPDRVLIVQYEAMVARPHQEAQRIFEFAGLPVGSQTVSFLQEATQGHSTHKRSAYKPPETAVKRRTQNDPDIAAAIDHALVDSRLRPFFDFASGAGAPALELR